MLRGIRKAADSLSSELVPVVDGAARLALDVSRPLVPTDTGGLAASGRVIAGHKPAPTIASAGVTYDDPDGTAAYVHEGAHGKFTKAAPVRFLRAGFIVARKAFRKNLIRAVEKTLHKSFK